MNWEQISGKWDQLKGDVKSTWGKLTDDDIKYVNGKRDRLAGKIYERYGTLKEQALRDVDEWVKKAGEKIDNMGNKPGNH